MSALFIHQRERLATKLKNERVSGVEFCVALRDADNASLVLALEECNLCHHSVVVNRRRIKVILDTLMTRVALVPPMELAAQQKA